MESILQRRVRLSWLNAWQISQMTARLSRDELIPRAFSTQAVQAVIDNPDHQCMLAIIDVIDSSVSPQEPLPDTLSNVGSEERVSRYAQRFADGQSLFHVHDNGTFGVSKELHDEVLC